jgi:hypothetical protein
MKQKSIDRKKYGGKFVATKSFTSTDVIAWGDDPTDVYKEATEKGIKEPVINYVHREGVICIY